tara:strand:+ start:2676 stop:4709 length:2034 start_codon:yes stop_codon:yes gene_type:complete
MSANAKNTTGSAFTAPESAGSASKESIVEGIQAMIKKVETDLCNEYMKDKNKKDAEYIERLSFLLSKLDKKLKNAISGELFSESKDSSDAKVDTKQESASDADDSHIILNNKNGAKVRWHWNKGDKDAKGVIRLNHKCLSQISKIPPHIILMLDISNSMNDRPLEELSSEMISFITELVELGLKIKLTVMAYGRFANVFIDGIVLNSETYKNICEKIKNTIGSPVTSGGSCSMGGKSGIRGSTNFMYPLREAFSRIKDYKSESRDGAGAVVIWYSDGIEFIKRGEKPTDIYEEIAQAFPDGISDLNVDICTATYGAACGENTKMQELSSYWDDNCKHGSGFFTSADNIPGLARFAYESIQPRLITPLATDIQVIIPCETDSEDVAKDSGSGFSDDVVNKPFVNTREAAELRGDEYVPDSEDVAKGTRVVHFKKLGKNPIDIPFTLPVTLPVRVGVPNTPFDVQTDIRNILFKFKDTNGENKTLSFDLIDNIQFANDSSLINSPETKTAHILNEVKLLSEKITGLPSKANEELPMNKKCLELLNQLGSWNQESVVGSWNREAVSDNWKWVPVTYQRGSNVYPVTAPHQIPSKNEFDVLKSSIRAAEIIIKKKSERLTKSDSGGYYSDSDSDDDDAVTQATLVYRSAATCFTDARRQQSQGYSQRSAYDRGVSSYGVDD